MGRLGPKAKEQLDLLPGDMLFRVGNIEVNPKIAEDVWNTTNTPFIAYFYRYGDPLEKDFEDWTCNDVAYWLTKELNLPEQFAEKCVTDDIDGSTLMKDNQKKVKAR